MRVCGDCSLCCKLPEIPEAATTEVPEVAKPADQWCVYCRPGRGGCSIHPNRPQVCRNFDCQWIKNAKLLGEEWKPNRCGMVIVMDDTGERVLCRIYVDPAKPLVWREPQYRTRLGQIALAGLIGRLNYHTIVQVKQRLWLILPDSEIDITGRRYVIRGEHGRWLAEAA